MRTARIISCTLCAILSREPHISPKKALLKRGVGGWGGLQKIVREVEESFQWLKKAPWRPVQRERRREDIIRKLLIAIEDAFEHAQKIPADIDPNNWKKLKYYHLVGYLAGVLNAILSKADYDEIMERLSKVEVTVDTKLSEGG